MKAKPFVAAALSLGLLAGCASPYGGYGGGYGYNTGYNTGYGGGDGMFDGNKQTVGTILGGVVGGLAGSRFGGGTGKLVTTGLGTLIGAALGNAAGRSLDRADHSYAQQAAGQAYAAPTGSTIRWNNPQSGNWGSFTPTRDGVGPSGEHCREFQTSLAISGRIEQGYGTACRQPDGTWRVVG